MTNDTRRLNTDLRHEIASKLMASLPSQDTSKWTKRMAELAEKARMYGVSDGEKRRLANMECKWGIGDHDISVNIGGLRRYDLQFSGSVQYFLSERARRSYQTPEPVYKQVRSEFDPERNNRYSHFRGNHADTIVIPGDSQLAKDINALIDEMQAAAEEYNTKHAAAWAALNNANTVKQLIERWPEVAPFVPPPPPPEALPVIQRDELNASFNLPLSKNEAKKVANQIVVK